MRHGIAPPPLDDQPGFNPRTREGCDPCYGDGDYLKVQFQSTHPRGVRLEDIILYPMDYCFNPRTREGCDPKGTPSLNGLKSFNPRTREGCDWIASQVALPTLTFQSTHPRGVRRQSGTCENWRGRFQSTHPRGVRRELGLHRG